MAKLHIHTSAWMSFSNFFLKGLCCCFMEIVLKGGGPKRFSLKIATHSCSGYCKFPRLYITKGKALTLIGSLINGTSVLGHAQFHTGRTKGDDPKIDTSQTPKRLDGHLTLLEKIRKTFTDSIPNTFLYINDCRLCSCFKMPHCRNDCWGSD